MTEPRYLFNTQVVDSEGAVKTWAPVVAFTPVDASDFVARENTDGNGKSLITSIGTICSVVEIPASVPIVPLDNGRMRACYANARILDFVAGAGDGQIKEDADVG